MVTRVHDLRRRLELVLGRTVDKTELQSDLLVELLELLENQRGNDD